MDPLVLVRVAAALDATLRQAVAREVLDDGAGRFRLVFARDERPLSLTISLRPSRPWVGRPPRPPGNRPRPRFASPVAARLSKEIRGRVVSHVDHAAPDRWLRLRFADGSALVAELAGVRANLLLLDRTGRVSDCARRLRAGGRPLEPGRDYDPPRLPPSRIDPFTTGAAEIDRRLALGAEATGSIAEAARRELFGIGPEAARLVRDECRVTARSFGEVLVERLHGLLAGCLDPVYEGPDRPFEAADLGQLDPSSCHLLPWPPHGAQEAERSSGAGPLETAGLFHAALDRAEELRERGSSLLAILDSELGRTRRTAAAVAADLAGFASPDRFRLYGEALLAGLNRAERRGSVVVVPDPYASDDRVLAVPVEPGARLTDAAEDFFRRHRRAERGLAQALARRTALDRRAGRLAELRACLEGRTDRATLERLELDMLRDGMPVGLDRPASRRAAGAPVRPARLAGARVFETVDGETLLVGRSGPDNQRLTFGVAAAEDFWFHALGVPGAHVILRNRRGAARPSAASVATAAALAAWFSEARDEPLADVQWTRRKYVRKARGAPPGTVIVKRSETVRVRPAVPDAGILAR